MHSESVYNIYSNYRRNNAWGWLCLDAGMFAYFLRSNAKNGRRRKKRLYVMNFVSLNSECSNKYIAGMYITRMCTFQQFFCIFVIICYHIRLPRLPRLPQLQRLYKYLARGQVDGELFQIFFNSYAWDLFFFLLFYHIAYLYREERVRTISHTIYFTT